MRRIPSLLSCSLIAYFAGCGEPYADIVVNLVNLTEETETVMVESAVEGQALDPTVIPAANRRFIIRIPASSSGEVMITTTSRDAGECRLGRGTVSVHYERGLRPEVSIDVVALAEARCPLVIHAPPSGRVFSCPDGVTCASGQTCEYEYPRGQKLNLDTTALSQWSGACQGSDTCSLTMDRKQEVTAAVSHCTGATCWVDRAKTGDYVSEPYQLSLRRIWGASADDLWVVGDQGRRMHWNGACWSQYQDPEGPPKTTEELMDVWGSSKDNLWAVGLKPNRSILHYQAGVWSADSAAKLYQDLLGVHGRSDEDFWAVGKKGVILHFDGTRWSQVMGGTSQDLYAVWVAGKDDVWVGGAQVLKHFDGSTWRDAAIVYNAAPPPSARQMIMTLWGTTPQNLWAAGMHNLILHFDGTQWQEDPRSQQDEPERNMYRRIWGAHERHIWIVGTNCQILNWTGESWKPDAKSRYLKENCYFEGVFGTSALDTWVAGGGLNIPGLGPRVDGLLLRYRP